MWLVRADKSLSDDTGALSCAAKCRTGTRLAIDAIVTLIELTVLIGIGIGVSCATIGALAYVVVIVEAIFIAVADTRARDLVLYFICSATVEHGEA